MGATLPHTDKTHKAPKADRPTGHRDRQTDRQASRQTHKARPGTKKKAQTDKTRQLEKTQGRQDKRRTTQRKTNKQKGRGGDKPIGASI